MRLHRPRSTLFISDSLSCWLVKPNCQSGCLIANVRGLQEGRGQCGMMMHTSRASSLYLGEGGARIL